MGAARGTTVRGSHPLFCTILAILFLGERPSFWVILADRMADARKLACFSHNEHKRDG